MLSQSNPLFGYNKLTLKNLSSISTEDTTKMMVSVCIISARSARANFVNMHLVVNDSMQDQLQFQHTKKVASLKYHFVESFPSLAF